MSATWYCTRQRAGPLVKECRALRPRFESDDTQIEHSGKSAAKRYIRTAVNRSSIDRLEERLAVIGWDATQYTLTFDDEHLPQRYADLQRAQRSFVKRDRRWRESVGRIPDFDWISVLEGLHGDHRYHIHFICDYNALSPAEVSHLWRGGDIVDASPVLLNKEGFRRLAVYFHKERRDGYVIPVGKQPFTCSRTLSAKLEPPQRWRSEDGAIEPPEDAICFSTPTHRPEPFDNGWGAFYKLSWLEPDGSPECRAAMRRMGYVEESYLARATDKNRAHARGNIS